VRRIARIGIGLVALSCAAGAAAQSFNQSINRYRAAKAVCAEAYQERIERRCNAACRTAAAARQTKCLSAAEETYRAAIRRELRPRR
jgi:hypothetical protein